MNLNLEDRDGPPYHLIHDYSYQFETISLCSNLELAP